MFQDIRVKVKKVFNTENDFTFLHSSEIRFEIPFGNIIILGWSEILSECVGVARGMKNESLVEFLKRWDVESKTGPDPFPLHLAVQNADLTEVKDCLFIFFNAALEQST